jgi:diguanylate cyclase (GGDEF)-like protein
MARSPYILLVEDNPGDARLTQALLSEPEGTELPPICWVQATDAAVQCLTSRPGCVAVLLDLGLPDSQGLEALHSITRHNEQVPIIVLTGNDSEPLGLDAVVAGAQDVLVKGSFDAAVLRRCIRFSSQRKQAEVALLVRSLHDELTGLPRRSLLLDRLQAALDGCARSAGSGALLFVDLDHFKQINDTQGHAAGDAVLCEVALRLKAAVRATDTVARMGGDEFVVLLPSTTAPADALAVGHKLLAALAAPIHHGAQALAVSASLGVAKFAGGTETAAGLMARADAAMYAAKQAGRGVLRVL